MSSRTDTPPDGIPALPAVGRTPTPDDRRATLGDLNSLEVRLTGRQDKTDANVAELTKTMGEVEKHTIAQTASLNTLVKAEEKRERQEARVFDANTQTSLQREKTFQLKTSARARIIIAAFSFLSAVAGAAGAYFAMHR